MTEWRHLEEKGHGNGEQFQFSQRADDMRCRGDGCIRRRGGGPLGTSAERSSGLLPSVPLQVRIFAVRAVQAAIAVYLTKAKTGQLPRTLPADLPKAPHTGKDFVYQATEEGFILRCGVRFAAYGGYGPNPEPLQFEFQVTERKQSPALP